MEQAIATMWEYKVYSEGIRARMSEDKLLDELNELGMEGWEVVCYRGDGSYILKRPA